jgi:hypothetical protein
VNWYNNGRLPVIRQFLLIPNRVNKLVDYRQMFCVLLESVLLEFNHYLAIYTFLTLSLRGHRQRRHVKPCVALWAFKPSLDNLGACNFATAISTSGWLVPGTNGSDVYTSICITSQTLCMFSNWEKYFLYLFKILWESASRSPFSSFTKLFVDW